MEKTFNIGRMKAEAMAKAFGVDIEKAAHGVYEDNAENRRLNRVGQEYGKKAEEKQAVGKQPKQGEQTEQEKKTSAATMESAAQGASDEALKRASQDPKAPEDVKAAAKKELENRSGAKKEEKGAEGEKKSISVKEKIFKDYKKLSSEDMFKRGFDVGEAEENYMKEDEEGNVEIISFQSDGTVFHDKVDAETGDEDMKEYKSREEFMNEFVTPEMREEYKSERDAEENEKKKREGRAAKRGVVRSIRENGGGKELDDFLQKNSEHFKSVLDQYGAKDFFDLQDKVEEKYADDDDDPYGYEHMEKLYFKCLHAVPDEKFIGMEGKL